MSSAQPIVAGKCGMVHTKPACGGASAPSGIATDAPARPSLPASVWPPLSSGVDALPEHCGSSAGSTTTVSLPTAVVVALLGTVTSIVVVPAFAPAETSSASVGLCTPRQKCGATGPPPCSSVEQNSSTVGVGVRAIDSSSLAIVICVSSQRSGSTTAFTVRAAHGMRAHGVKNTVSGCIVTLTN